MGGISGLLFGGGILQGAKDWTLSLFSSVFLIPAWPALYLLTFGWQFGELFGLAWLGSLIVSLGIALAISIALVTIWVVALKLISQHLPDFVAGMIAPCVFVPAPLLCLFAL